MGLLAYFLSRVPLADVGRTLGRVKLEWVLASTVLSLASYALRALRWGVILEPLGKARRTELLGCTAAGFAASTILPARAGEVIRPLLLSARTGLAAAGTVASILTERLADLATVLVLFALGVAFSFQRFSPGALRPLHEAALLAGAGLAAAAVLLLVLLRRREAAVAAFTRALPSRFRERGAKFLHHLLDGLEVVRSPRGLVRLGLWSLATWLAAVLQVTALATAFGISLPPLPAAVFMAVSVIGLAVPTPAGVGGFHAAIQFALTRLFGVDVADATAFALLHHAVCFIPVTVAGLGYIAGVGLSLGKVRVMAEPETEAGQGA